MDFINEDYHIDKLFDDRELSMENFRINHIFENRESQLSDLDTWMSEITKIWNFAYEENYNPKWNERVLLCIYICNYFRLKGSYRLDSKYAETNESVADRLYNLLNNFPNIDALDEIFLDDLKDSVYNLMLFIDNL